MRFKRKDSRKALWSVMERQRPKYHDRVIVREQVDYTVTYEAGGAVITDVHHFARET